MSGNYIFVLRSLRRVMNVWREGKPEKYLEIVALMLCCKIMSQVRGSAPRHWGMLIKVSSQYVDLLCLHCLHCIHCILTASRELQTAGLNSVYFLPFVWVLFSYHHYYSNYFYYFQYPPSRLWDWAERHRWNMTLIIVATIYWHFSTFSWQQLLPAANNRSAYPEHQSSGLARLRSSGVTALLSTRRLNEKNNSWELTKLAIKHCFCCKNDSTLTFLSSKALYCGPLWSTVVHCCLTWGLQSLLVIRREENCSGQSEPAVAVAANDAVWAGANVHQSRSGGSLQSKIGPDGLRRTFQQTSQPACRGWR